MRAPLCLAAAAVVALAVSPAGASTFDERGVLSAQDDAVAFESFDAPERVVPADAEPVCLPEHYEVMSDATLALEGASYVHVSVPEGCAERFAVTPPEGQGSYRASVWIRHGSASARMLVKYPDELALPLINAQMAPTGRATSDGWIELASNEFPVDMTLAPSVYLFVADYAAADGIDVDALELTPFGEFREAPACEGVRDPVCGEDAICVAGSCRLGALTVPPLPSETLREEVARALELKLQNFFGGRKTRLSDLPNAVETLVGIRSAKTAWQFWNGWATAMRQLHDWHTRATGAIAAASPRGRLNACFIEGDADLSRDVLPSDPRYKDILVSHVGTMNTAGLQPGDRLVAVDGQHPIEWATQLIDVNWGYQIASDDTSFADFAEGLGGRFGLLLQFAKTFSVIRCDRTTMTCADVVETLNVNDLPGGMGGGVSCDNRPSYHLGENSPGQNHNVFYDFYQGPIEGTTEEEAIYGMVWDTLYGGGDPNGYVNGVVRNAISFWRENARGVILDHRAGNGGTIDTPQYITELLRPERDIATDPSFIISQGFSGPDNEADGVSLYDYLVSQGSNVFRVGSSSYDGLLPVALITHRDGSASDYLPLGVQGSPKAKIFGPGPTAGAFSTFFEFSYWGSISFQFASGDTITDQGEAKIGYGIVPDVIVQQKQSDLMQGIDTIHEAALAWVRQELKPL